MNQPLPLIVQSDRSLLLEVNHPLYNEIRNAIIQFAEIEKSPEHIHTYKISHLSLWNAAASGINPESVCNTLDKYSRYPVPNVIKDEIKDYMSRFGKIKLIKEDDTYFLFSKDENILQTIQQSPEIENYLIGKANYGKIPIDPLSRGSIKQTLIKLGFPVEDIAGYTKGTPFNIELDKSLKVRSYQKNACDLFYASGTNKGGNGVIVLPCGAGKTIVGMTVMAKIKTNTLILVTNISAAKQWKRELIDKTSLTEDDIGEYNGESKDLKPITIATYQVITYRKGKTYPHFFIFDKGGWGLIVYDEVHLLPAPIFRITSDLQARRRIGLTATLVREDKKEEDVFSLIGPKKYDVPWKDLEEQGWIATATCTEVHTSLADEKKIDYATASLKDKIRIAMENPAKKKVVELIMERHRGDRILIIGQYIDQLDMLSKEFGIPLITGKTKNSEREKLYDMFRSGEVEQLIVSKVGNFAIDLPDANVAIQISGTFGSRQEEAQRLGRILRPKTNKAKAFFYSVVTRETRDQEFAMNRQLFLTEQGYEYKIISSDELY